MEKEGLLCWKCREEVPYTIKYRKKIRAVDEKQYEYMEKYGQCDICNSEIMVPGLDDENERLFDGIIRADKGLIFVDEINELLLKYNIEKRPLSHVLGMGEHTISRYIEGALPNKKYSDLLRNLLSYHVLMREYLEKNRDSISPAAYKKTDRAIKEIEKMCLHNTKIELIALYIIHKSFEVTDLSLQKMLYYVKAFSWIHLKRDIFEDDCEAWAYGPVFPEIYYKYKTLGSNIIPDYDKTINYSELLKTEELNVLDYVINCFGIFNGSVLMKITHKERPWKEARNGLPEFAPSRRIIDNEIIHEYFDDMNKMYNLNKVEGVNTYIHNLGVIGTAS